MLRLKKEHGWLLVTHRAHAVLAGDFAKALNGAAIVKPEPYLSVLDAVYHHDDSWIMRDEEPFLTPEGLPSAFSRELVGAYAAFEEIDLDDYLAVRRQATEDAAARDRYAAILISMHTDNLLTEQADLTTLTDSQSEIHAAFIQQQSDRRNELVNALKETGLDSDVLSEASLQEGFEFLQACDSCSLYTCTSFPEPVDLRFGLMTCSGDKIPIQFSTIGEMEFSLDPWPFAEKSVQLSLPARYVEGDRFDSVDAFRAAYSKAIEETFVVKLREA